MFIEQFQSDLLPGESVLWTGQPSTRVIFHKHDGYAVPITLFFAYEAGLWLVADLHLIGPPSYRARALDPTALFADVLWCLIALYLVVGRFLALRWKKKHIYYAITDHRALILHNYGRRKLVAVPLDSASTIKKTVRDDGNGTIRFGEQRERSIRVDEFRRSGVPAFGDIDDANQVYEMIVRQRDRARAHA